MDIYMNLHMNASVHTPQTALKNTVVHASKTPETVKTKATTPQESGLNLAQHARALNLSQSHIAKAIGIDQSQVSRIFDGRVKKPSDTMVKISQYLDLKKSDLCSTITHNQTLMEALALTWDGSEAHAHALADIIKNLGNFALKK